MYIPFSEELGGTATDRSDEGNDGTLSGFTGTAESGSNATTLVDTANLSTTAGSYIGTYVEMTSGDNDGLKRLVTAYNESTQTITVNAFPNAIAVGNTYIVGWYPREGPSWTTGKHGNALEFDGTDDFLDAGDDDTLEELRVNILEQIERFEERVTVQDMFFNLDADNHTLNINSLI